MNLQENYGVASISSVLSKTRRNTIERRKIQLPKTPVRKYSDAFEKWAYNQPMRYSNGLSISDTVIPGKKPKKEKDSGRRSKRLSDTTDS